jgi:hypothetical protein
MFVHRFGWGSGDVYGRFVSTAVLVLGLALLASVAVHRGADAEDVAAAPPSKPVPVLGANIAASPAIAAALRMQVTDLPWERTLVRQDSQTGSIFIPANDLPEAFALCAKLADVPPACAPAVASTDQLRMPNGVRVNQAQLAKFGIAPYAPTKGRWTKVVSAEDLNSPRT